VSAEPVVIELLNQTAALRVGTSFGSVKTMSNAT